MSSDQNLRALVNSGELDFDDYEADAGKTFHKTKKRQKKQFQ